MARVLDNSRLHRPGSATDNRSGRPGEADAFGCCQRRRGFAAHAVPMVRHQGGSARSHHRVRAAAVRCRPGSRHRGPPVAKAPPGSRASLPRDLSGHRDQSQFDQCRPRLRAQVTERVPAAVRNQPGPAARRRPPRGPCRSTSGLSRRSRQPSSFCGWRSPTSCCPTPTLKSFSPRCATSRRSHVERSGPWRDDSLFSLCARNGRPGREAGRLMSAGALDQR